MEWKTAAMRDMSRRAFPETNVVVPDGTPTPFGVTRSERRRQAEMFGAAALRRALAEKAGHPVVVARHLENLA
ncbi:hypothetical protein CLM85_03780 [Streptomyces albidoflavus]|uniref:hypothetical protein n=1 Tax=Streptomyces albidoflavus TaxID=1886 RepID=UPI000BAE1FA7|nr:hypothetical protein [Streptomyces albidoflavus]PAX88622.1 hypothetical protein CLM81_02235 [Streptomyces albidoflavus]PAX89168.1 hypothetical protein CLM82_22625 [Streptomyces albidoflavus]PBO18308.1 hypothetical protein CLM83_13045 [Streptomyces albidoflavus]PBO25526.1 hypothetical protein CLM85_03780 [Streptomyces albidoflavus]PBO27633.1 hypothetical protein CLM84_24650 [Streptomyces albidoflavus]